jgi:hypothetical protein
MHALVLGIGLLGEQGLAETALIVGDQVAGGTEDMFGGAVVALEPDDLGAGEVLLEAQDVFDFRAAPAIDRLVVVADAADVGVASPAGRWASAAADQAEPHVLRGVGVLVLVDQDESELALVLLEHVRIDRGRCGSAWQSRSPKSTAFRVCSRSW